MEFTMSHLLESLEEGLACCNFGVGDLDFDFGLGFSTTFSSAGFSGFSSGIFSSSSSSDFESTSESEDVLVLSSSLSVFECSPEKKYYTMVSICFSD